jgi:hypothetical protein
MSIVMKVILFVIVPFRLLKGILDKRVDNNELSENEHLFI